MQEAQRLARALKERHQRNIFLRRHGNGAESHARYRARAFNEKNSRDKALGEEALREKAFRESSHAHQPPLPLDLDSHSEHAVGMAICRHLLDSLRAQH